jgi:hypothetical protein
MKKLSTTFLILFTLLTFSNSVFAGFFSYIFGDIFNSFGSFNPVETFKSTTDVKDIRCKVEYTQLDLTTGLEKNIKHTAQYEVNYVAHGNNLMYLSAQDLTENINIWLNESKNNVVSNMTGINCKEGRQVFSILHLLQPQIIWNEYKSCEDEYNIDLINLLVRPKQWGYNVNIERLIKDYEEGCKNYIGEGY